MVINKFSNMKEHSNVDHSHSANHQHKNETVDQKQLSDPPQNIVTNVPWYKQGVFWLGVGGGLVIFMGLGMSYQMWQFRNSNWLNSFGTYGRYSMMGVPGMMGFYGDQQNIADPLTELQNQMAEIEKRNQQLYEQFNQVQKTPFGISSISKFNGSGEVAFSVKGKNYGLAYQLSNQKLILDLTDLRKYFTENPDDKVSLMINGADGTNLLKVKSLEDLKQDKVEISGDNVGRKVVSLQIAGADKNNIVNIKQVL